MCLTWTLADQRISQGPTRYSRVQGVVEYPQHDAEHRRQDNVKY